ncbi:MAG TPA: hypothetical protein ENO23_10200 [Alphaproteobacteria bacterium]|nr:hypothetical protein [Alphaproteobacteria bacterium]
MAAASSCSPVYTYDPAEEPGGVIDQTTREEIREIRGEFWCNGYGDYFEPDEFDEIWCVSGGGLCRKYEDLVDGVLNDGNYDGGDFWVKARLSGFVGVPIDWYYELDCTRVFYVTSVHWIRVVRPKEPKRTEDEE